MASRVHRRRLRRHRNNHNGGGSRKLFVILGTLGVVTLAAFGALFGVAFSVYTNYASDLQTPDELIRETSLGGTWLFDRNGTLLYQFADPDAGLRQPVTLDEIAPSMINATISTEDASFYDNPGVNVRGLARAATENLLPSDDVDFFEGSGGSSITQQLVKNLYIDREDRGKRGWDGVPRKIRETVIALELTRKYEKDQILEWYLNQIFYGNNAYGVEAAARRYFDKPASELTLAESAMLAGIPSSPLEYDPIVNLEAAKIRQAEVLDLMVRRDMISQAEADAAKAEQLQFRSPDDIDLLAPHWVFHMWNPDTGEGVLLEMCLQGLIEKPDDWTCEDLMLRGGLRVTTTLDLTMQSAAEEILEKWISRYEASSQGHNGAMMAMDPETGQVLVYVGSRDYNNAEIQGENDMIQALNSPGSSFKPIVYLTAFMQGWAPASVIVDSPVTVKNEDGSTFRPSNPNGDYKGAITVRQALGASLNVPAIKTAMEIGIGPVIDQAHRMGYTSFEDKSQFGPALATGGGDLRLYDHVYAFSAFPNNGIQRGIPAYRADKPAWWPELRPVEVLRVTNVEGDVLYDQQRPDERRVAPAAESYMIANVLSDDAARAATFGRGSSLNLPGYTAGVKTGTSEPYVNSRAIGETWTVGFTTHLVTGVWIGNADNSPMVNISSATVAQGSWNEFMRWVHGTLNLPPEEFERPPDVVEANVTLPGRGCTPSGRDLVKVGQEETYKHAYCRTERIDRRTGEPATEDTPPEFVTERTVIEGREGAVTVSDGDGTGAPQGPPDADDSEDQPDQNPFARDGTPAPQPPAPPPGEQPEQPGTEPQPPGEDYNPFAAD